MGSEKMAKGYFSDTDKLRYLARINKSDTMVGCYESLQMIQGRLYPNQRKILKSWYDQSRHTLKNFHYGQTKS